MAAITTAGVHSAGLHRLGCHPQWHTKLQETLGILIDSPGTEQHRRWRPRTLQPVVWQTPGFMLKLSITCFLVGLIILIWDAAERDGLILGNDDRKVVFRIHLFGVRADTSPDRHFIHMWCWNFSDLVYYVCAWPLFQNSRIRIRTSSSNLESGGRSVIATQQVAQLAPSQSLESGKDRSASHSQNDTLAF